MKTVRAGTGDFYRRRGCSLLIGCLLIPLGLALLTYYAYCWGWWGQGSLLAQYLFQCGCPISSEPARYPERVDVVIPACHYGGVRLSPSGRFLYVREKRLWLTSTYLLDLQTDEKIPFALPEGYFHFLTDDLLYLHYGGGEYILDPMTDMKYPIQSFRQLQPGAIFNGYVDPDLLLNAFLQVEKVFLVDAPSQPVIALSSDFRTHPEHSFIFYEFDLPVEGTNPVEQFLQQNNIIYYRATATFPTEAISPNERFMARYDGIYLVETNQKIVEGYSAGGEYHEVQGWSYDGRGVIYFPFLGPCLIETNFFIFDDTGCFFEVPQPVLLLKVPPEYLAPTPGP